jgi:PadR family transcriptional regulator, regulatory protein PadR
MAGNVRLSGPTLKVLKLFLEAPRQAHSGAEIARATGIGSGTLYPLLARLEAAGWCASEWEAISPSEAGRPRRRFYTLTGVGQTRACAAFADLRLGPTGDLAWTS